MAYWGHCRQTGGNKEAEAERSPPAALKLGIDDNKASKNPKGNYLKFQLYYSALKTKS